MRRSLESFTVASFCGKFWATNSVRLRCAMPSAPSTVTRLPSLSVTGISRVTPVRALILKNRPVTVCAETSLPCTAARPLRLNEFGPGT
jgi:hypothetical protein